MMGLSARAGELFSKRFAKKRTNHRYTRLNTDGTRLAGFRLCASVVKNDLGRIEERKSFGHRWGRDEHRCTKGSR